MPRLLALLLIGAATLLGARGEKEQPPREPAPAETAMACVRAQQGAGAELYTGGEGRDCTICSGDARRTFTLYEPADLPDGPVPLVITIHGEGGPDATRSATAAASRWDLQAFRAGIMVAFPEANGGD